MAYEHLRLEREAPINLRHPRRGGGGFTPPDPRAYGAALGTKLQAARARITDPEQADIGGFDERKLIKIHLHPGDKSVPAFDAIPGVEIVRAASGGQDARHENPVDRCRICRARGGEGCRMKPLVFVDPLIPSPGELMRRFGLSRDAARLRILNTRLDRIRGEL